MTDNGYCPECDGAAPNHASLCSVGREAARFRATKDHVLGPGAGMSSVVDAIPRRKPFVSWCSACDDEHGVASACPSDFEATGRTSARANPDGSSPNAAQVPRSKPPAYTAEQYGDMHAAIVDVLSRRHGLDREDAWRKVSGGFSAKNYMLFHESSEYWAGLIFRGTRREAEGEA